MKIFIAGSACENIPEKYIKETEKLGEKLLNTEHEIYCCASDVGLIGSIYNPFLKKAILDFFFSLWYLFYMFYASR